MATTTERLQIIIEALNLSRDEMKQLQQDLEGTKTETKESTTRIDRMRSTLSTLTVVAGTATAAFFTLKKAMDFAEQGAQLELMDDRLNRLAKTIGTTGERLRADLADTMGDITSRAEQTKVAVDLLSLGLVDNQEQLSRLARVASQLDFDMNQLVLTLTNQTIRRFDQLGVSVDGFDEKVEELSETMSDQDAFTMAFIEQAEEQVEKLGDVSETAAGQFKEAQANWEDFTDNLKRGTLEAVLPAVRAMNESFSVNEKLNSAVEKGIITEEERINLINRMRRSTFDSADALQLLTSREQELANITANQVNPELRLHNRLMGEAGDKSNDWTTSIKNAVNVLSNFTDEALKAQAINQALGRTMEDSVITQEEFAGVLDLAETLEFDLPEGIRESVANFNILSGNVENIGNNLNAVFNREYSLKIRGEFDSGNIPEGVADGVTEQLMRRLHGVQ